MSVTVFTVVFVVEVPGGVFNGNCSSKGVVASDDVDEDRTVGLVCWLLLISYICLSNNRIRSSNVMRPVDISSSPPTLLDAVRVLLLFVSIVGSFLELDKLFKPNDECFK